MPRHPLTNSEIQKRFQNDAQLGSKNLTLMVSIQEMIYISKIKGWGIYNKS